MRTIEFNSLVGKTIVEITGAKKGSECIALETSDGCIYRMFLENEKKKLES